MKSLLAIDTAHGRCSAALLSGGVIKSFYESATPSKQAEELFGVMGRVLAEGNAQYADIGQMAVCIGPGSFTGVRIGLAAAQGFCFGHDIPLFGITSLEAIAFHHGEKEKTTFVAINAQRGQAYAQAFRGLTPLGDAALHDTGELAKIAEGFKADSITGNCGEFLKESRIPVGSTLFYDARHLALAAQAKQQAGMALAPAIPLYIREPDAKLPAA
jgi:tRNA threonylcarbamoyladenosine biosynthesis protein TsaB